MSHPAAGQSAQDPAKLRHTFDMDLWDRIGTAVIQWQIDCDEHAADPRNHNIVGPNGADYVMAIVQPALDQAETAAVDAVVSRLVEFSERSGIDEEQRRILRGAVRIAQGENL